MSERPPARVRTRPRTRGAHHHVQPAARAVHESLLQRYTKLGWVH